MDDLKALQEVVLAKWTYEQLARIKDQTFGPVFRMYPDFFEIYDVIQVGLKKIIEGIGSDKIVQVPSPWHAVLVLESLQHNLCIKNERVIFRGQFDSTWEIQPAIDRATLTESQKENERFKSKLFCDIMNTMSFNTLSRYSIKSHLKNLKIPAESYLAAAQHYGIATNLIDFTPDPAVAVYFAATGSQEKKNRTASIYVLDLRQAFENGCEVIIPPPFIKRLHIQRGLFLKNSNPDGEINFKNLCLFEIQFPCDFEYAPFHVIRHGRGRVNLLPPNASLEAVLGIVNKTALENEKEKISDGYYKDIVETSSHRLKQDFMSVYNDPMKMWAEYLDAFEDMLYWTCYFTDEKSLTLDLDFLLKIIDSNQDLVLSITQVYRYMITDLKDNLTTEKKNFINQLVAILEQPFYNRGILKYE